MLEWDVRSKVVSLVTDNAATMIKVAELLKIRHLPCFAHSLNLVVKETLREPIVKAIIEKCSSIVTHFKKSTVASDKLKSIQRELNKSELKLVKHIEVRWNSAYHMIQRIIQVRDELTLAINQLPNAPPNLTAEEYSFLSELETLLEPFESCTVAISGEKYVTISLIIPLLKGLCLRFVEFENTPHFSESARNVISIMKTSFNNKLRSFENRSACIIATLLNPHFKKAGFKTAADAERATNLVQKEYSLFLSSKKRNESETVEGLNEDIPQKKSKLQSLLYFVDQSNETQSVTADAIVDLRQYLEKPKLPMAECPSEYWVYNDNNLKHVALKYLCIPGCSTPSERVFSKAGQIITERRSRLKPERINELLFLSENRHLL